VGRAFAHRHKKDYGKAIADCTAAIRLNPKNPDAHDSRGCAYTDTKQYEKATEDFTEALRIDPKHVETLNDFAWLLATCPKAALRDGKKAMQYATKACEAANWKDAYYLGTFAAAHAECGNFKEAIKWQKKAIEIGYDDKTVTENAHQCLKSYQAGKPYREE
jgi:tetratricopeptide (TPR) repeat protein